jgi:hypothetical protein
VTNKPDKSNKPKSEGFYTLTLKDPKGRVVSERSFSFNFDSIVTQGVWSSRDEFLVGREARFMFRDAAVASGKVPNVRRADGSIKQHIRRPVKQ